MLLTQKLFYASAFLFILALMKGYHFITSLCVSMQLPPSSKQKNQTRMSENCSFKPEHSNMIRSLFNCVQMLSYMTCTDKSPTAGYECLLTPPKMASTQNGFGSALLAHPIPESHDSLLVEASCSDGIGEPKKL